MGEVMRALTASITWVTDPIMVKGVVVVKALQFAMDIRFHKIVLKGDYIGVLKRLSLYQQDFSGVGMVVEEGKVLLSHLDSCNIVHVLRDENTAAITLTQIEVGQLHDVVWVEDYPPSIHDIIFDDVNQAFI
ncbi:hypothetical protein PTKIN_Ptkin04bG0123000 [Pterospermum kingtungense]